MNQSTTTHFDVSVIVCAYNAAKYLPRAIDSIMGQTLAASEIIIVDDGSTDNTKSVVASYGETVRYIYQDNAGPGDARNTGIKAASSEWIAFLDADDEWLPEKLQLQSEIIERHPDIRWVSGNYLCCFCDKGTRRPQNQPGQIRRLLHGRDYYEDILDGFVSKIRGYTGTMLIRRDVLLETGLFKTEWNLAEDVDLWLRIAFRHPPAGFAVQPIAIYHMETGDSLSRKPIDARFLEVFLKRHLAFAEDRGRQGAFKPYAIMMLYDWMRSAKFDDRVYDIRHIANVFSSLLSIKDKAVLYSITVAPGLTRLFFGGLSRLSRVLKLRCQTWHSTDKFVRNQ